MDVQVLSYEVPGWGVGELYFDAERLLYHELPSERDTRADRVLRTYLWGEEEEA